MDDPLAELDAWWSGKDEDGYDSDTVLLAYAETGRSEPLDFPAFEETKAVRIEFATLAPDARAEWRLAIDDCVESRWCGERGDPRWAAGHALLAPYRDRPAWISFSKPLPDALRAWGAVAQAHRALAGDWFPLSRFLRETMFDQPFGVLAQGPERFMAAYEAALRALGADVAMAVPDSARHRSGPPALGVVIWGDSFFVARSFRLERTDSFSGTVPENVV